MSSDNFDAVLLLSFGGPEKMADVRPFLENVTRGRGIPPERLDEVGAHYAHFGGKSPLNDLNREIVANLEAELARRGYDLPVYFGNRNWHPMAEDTAAQMADDGVKRALVFATSAWGGYSGCRQYHEDIARVRESLGDHAFDMEKIRSFYDHPLFIEAYADAVRKAFAKLPEDRRDEARLIFTAHSIPVSADKASGPVELGGNLYSRQVNESAQLVADAVGVTDFDVVWQSRSGPEHVPWLEPDIVDHVEAEVAKGLRSAVVCPIGFISDHVEVAWDLDAELQEEMAHHDIVIERVATPGPTNAFTNMIVELIEERIADVEPRRLGSEPLFGSACNGAPCSTTCCTPAKRRPH
ncbi:ferrochelatase [uncultured Corynebacterium sp.]|uniref:ferrochelatase n=1 Tax=uncultured Corynebacterium sp. TaxID=159447 RepID=UPI00261909C3|nr:ferrochelatase [uncultured Corynebacterium sp.]